MFYERRLMFGIPPDECVGDYTLDPEELLDSDAVDYESGEAVAFDGEAVIPVFARPYTEERLDRNGVDHSAEILTGDVSEGMSLDAFDRAQAEYNGVDRRATPTNSFDDVSTEDYSHGYM